MRYIELFAGVGGFRYGLERANDNEYARIGAGSKPQERQQRREWATSESREMLCVGDNTAFSCVWANEWDKYAAAIYRYHWNDGTMHEGDIRAVDPAVLPAHDLIVGGFPCQAFSIAGKRGGFSDTRGTLFFEICRIARACGTKYLLLENVKGLLNHKGGATFQTIISTMDELGYDCQWQVLNSRYWIPQNRERVFIIGHLRGLPRPQVFPIGNCRGSFEKENGCQWLSDGSGIAYAIDANFYKGVANQARTMVYQTGHRAKGKVREYQDGSNIRRLTPIECERLQAFPDNWTQTGLFLNGKVLPISDTQRYKTMGNAVTTAVITSIGNKLKCYG